MSPMVVIDNDRDLTRASHEILTGTNIAKKSMVFPVIQVGDLKTLQQEVAEAEKWRSFLLIWESKV